MGVRQKTKKKNQKTSKGPTTRTLSGPAVKALERLRDSSSCGHTLHLPSSRPTSVNFVTRLFYHPRTHLASLRATRHQTHITFACRVAHYPSLLSFSSLSFCAPLISVTTGKGCRPLHARRDNEEATGEAEERRPTTCADYTRPPHRRPSNRSGAAKRKTSQRRVRGGEKQTRSPLTQVRKQRNG